MLAPADFILLLQLRLWGPAWLPEVTLATFRLQCESLSWQRTSRPFILMRRTGYSRTGCRLMFLTQKVPVLISPWWGVGGRAWRTVTVPVQRQTLLLRTTRVGDIRKLSRSFVLFQALTRLIMPRLTRFREPIPVWWYWG